MEQLSAKSVTICEDRYEDITSLRLVLRQKTHRKVLSGLRLLTETCKTARSNSSVQVSKVHVGPKDEDEKQSELPDDVIMYQILARLPIKSLLQTKSVSKVWYSTLSSNEFAKVHFKTRLSSYHPSLPVECLFIQGANTCYLFYLQEEERVLDYSLVKLEPNFGSNPHNELHLVGSCNGLVCLSDSVTGSFYIWNPIAYSSQKFSDFCIFSNTYRTSWGFAYVSSIDDYKVVRIAENYNTQAIIVHVFSLKTKEWKQIHSGFDHHVSLAKTNPGVLVNDTLYWIMATKNATRKHIVGSFNVVREKFEVVPGLFPKSTSFRDNFLCVMGGCLSMYSSDMHKEAYITIMKQPGVVESITLSSHSEPWSFSGIVGFTRTGKALVVSKNWELALVDLNSSPRQYFLLVTFAEAGKPCIVSYSPSLISPSAV